MLEYLSSNYINSRENELRERFRPTARDQKRKRSLWQDVLRSPAHIDLERL